jgi:hypothetical protein
MAYWLLVFAIWQGTSITSMPFIGEYLGLVVIGSILMPSLVALVLYRAMPAVAGLGDHPKYICLHPAPSHLGNDHILYSFLLVVLLIGVYTTALILAEVENLLLALGSPLAVLVTLATFFYGVTELNTRQHVARERTRESKALYLRAQCSRARTKTENERRCHIIELRFAALFTVVGLLGLPLLAVHKWLSGLLVQGAEPTSVVWQKDASIEASRLPATISATHVFNLNGFEERPVEGRLTLHRRDVASDPRAVAALRRDWTDHPENLEILVPPDVKPGTYELVVTIVDKDGTETSRLASGEFPHPPR